MARELSGDHAQVNGRLSQHFLGFECEQNRPAVKDINMVILLIADSGGLQNQENLLLRTFPLM